MKVFHLIIGQLQESRQQHKTVRFGQVLKPRDTVMLAFILSFKRSWQRWINFAVFIDPKKNRTIKAMMFGQYLGQHRHRLLAAILLLGGDQDNSLPFSWPLATRNVQP